MEHTTTNAGLTRTDAGHAGRKEGLMSSTHSIIRIAAIKASEAGALDGFEAVCSCGYRMTTSLGEREARHQGVGHTSFMNAKEARA